VYVATPLFGRVLVLLLFIAGLAGATGGSGLAIGPPTVDFESFATGSVNGQDGWTSGHGSSFCPVYDEGVVSNTYGYPSFGTQSLRISNAIACGSFNDQTFSPSLTDEAGETSASTSTYSGGTRQPFFEAQWDFASTVPGSEQPGLSVVASADRGDPSRMSWLQMTDTPAGLQLNFEDYQHALMDFVTTPIASGLDRTVPHTVKVTLQFVDGPSNDVVKVYLDGALIHTGTTWEDYYRDWAGGIPAPVDSMMFRVAGTPVPSVSGQGFLIDNFSSYSGPVPTADLTSLSLSSGTLSPAFDPSTTAYSASVDNATTDLVVGAGTNPGATAAVSGASNLAVGSNTVTITVTAADGTTTRTYTVTVDRAAPQAPTPPAPLPAPPTPLPATPTPLPATPTPLPATPTPLPATPTPLPAPPTPTPATPTPLPAPPTPTPATPAPLPAPPTPLPATPAPVPVPVDVPPDQPASTAFVVKVKTSRRIPLAIRHSFTPHILTTIAAKATISLTRYRKVHTTYATWSRTLKAGANSLTLRVPPHLKIKLPGVYRLTFRMHAQSQSRLYSVRVRLGWRVLGVALPKR